MLPSFQILLLCWMTWIKLVAKMKTQRRKRNLIRRLKTQGRTSGNLKLPRKVKQGRNFQIEKNHHCDKPHGREVKPIWAMRKPSEHKNFAKPQPKTTDSDLETTDELRSLLTDFKKYFLKARNLSCTN